MSSRSKVAGAVYLLTQFVSQSVQTAPHWFSIVNRPEFADVLAQLHAVVDSNGHHETNRFCVVGQKDGKYLQAYVYWPVENKMILWIPHLYDAQVLAHSKRYWDLTRDVVAENDVEGSTYLLTRADADATIRACHRNGSLFTIIKSDRKGR